MEDSETVTAHQEEYLADGVYAMYDGYQIWLRVEREGKQERIALEPKTFYALLELTKRHWDLTAFFGRV